ncbi:hypothetical protein M0813_24232 [Anaeramoeba flamelloides]|uniref:Uncharacterized protein n=1 Tax=Anaeramoeba flamelloides TaxID=1746091 RepID=A0ABQ8Y7D0_9EUKA|nr:hypothetical protein M0813_24232 [Anaeramoeba flamelloides]
MSKCKKNSGISPQLIKQFDSKLGQIAEIFPRFDSHFVINSQGEHLLASKNLDNQKIEMGLLLLSFKEEVSKTNFSFGVNEYSSFHILGDKEMFSCYLIDEFTLGFFSRREINKTKEFVDTSQMDKQMETIIADLRLLLNQMTKKK